MKNIAIKLTYKSSGVSPAMKEVIEDIRTSLKIDYIVNFKPNTGPQAGGLVDALMELILDFSLVDLVQILRDGFIFDTITRGKDSFALQPLFKAFQKLEANFLYWDYLSIRFYFEETTIEVIGVENMFSSKLPLIFKAIGEHYEFLLDNKLGKPTYILIPIEKVLEDGEEKFINSEPIKDYSIEEYQQFWGISYNSDYNKRVYDCNKQSLIEANWEKAY